MRKKRWKLWQIVIFKTISPPQACQNSMRSFLELDLDLPCLGFALGAISGSFGSPLGHASLETARRAALGLFFTAEMIHQLRLLCSLRDGYHHNKGLYAHDYPHTQCTVWCFMVYVLCTYTYIPYNTGWVEQTSTKHLLGVLNMDWDLLAAYMWTAGPTIHPSRFF